MKTKSEPNFRIYIRPLRSGSCVVWTELTCSLCTCVPPNPVNIVCLSSFSRNCLIHIHIFLCHKMMSTLLSIGLCSLKPQQDSTVCDKTCTHRVVHVHVGMRNPPRARRPRNAELIRFSCSQWHVPKKSTLFSQSSIHKKERNTHDKIRRFYTRTRLERSCTVTNKSCHLQRDDHSGEC